jgi:hypothetical protein
MTYGWKLHHLLNDVAQRKKGATELQAYFDEDARAFPPDAYRMYFTSNHDENSWNGTEFERMGRNHVPSFVLAAYGGARDAAALHRGRRWDSTSGCGSSSAIRWTGNGPNFAPWYRQVFALKRTQPALRNGAAGGPQRRLTTDGGERVYAFTRTRGANTVLVAVNFGDAPARGRLPGARPARRRTATGSATSA